MSEIKLTKHAMRSEQTKLAQLEKYLPTLQLKKALLQAEVNEARLEIQAAQEEYDNSRLQTTSVGGLLSQYVGVDWQQAARVEQIQTHQENIAGVEVPVFEGVTFSSLEYPLFSTPAWVDGALALLRDFVRAHAKVVVAQAKCTALEKELREVSIRVNLFEKNLIPKAQRNIKKIQVFLGDQSLAAVSQAKVAKKKIEKRKEARRAS